MNKTYDVVGLGSAIVDVLAHVDEAFLSKHDMRKGNMQLVDEAYSKTLYSQLGQTLECSGGSVANTLAGMASLSAKTAFIGKVANDQLGAIFTHDMKGVGVHYNSKTVTSPATANCLICVTPDGERTMSTYLGACTQLTEADINESLIASSSVFYIEGYQWDMDNAKAAIKKAIACAKKHSVKVALTLSDTFCVHRFREEFLSLIKDDVDILFANESELTALTEENDFDAAVTSLQTILRDVAAITRGAKGCVVVAKNTITSVSGEVVSKVVDTTGAGDLFASGFLYGLTHGKNLEQCAKLGNRCAAEIIKQLGARSMEPLHRLVA